MSRQKRIKEMSEEHLQAVETRLARVLQPITPPRDFAQRLRARIHWPEPGVIARRVIDWEFWFIVVSSVVSVTVLLVTLARALFHFFGRRNMAYAETRSLTEAD